MKIYLGVILSVKDRAEALLESIKDGGSGITNDMEVCAYIAEKYPDTVFQKNRWNKESKKLISIDFTAEEILIAQKSNMNIF